MTVICTDTNAMISGLPVPVGTFEFPFHGSLGVFTSGGVVTNFTCGAGDTLVVWGTGACLQVGTDPWQFFLAGLMVSWGALGLIAWGRRVARFLTGGNVKEV